MDIFILSFAEGTWSDSFRYDIGAFSTEEGARFSAEQDAGRPLRWEKCDGDITWLGHCSGDEEGSFYFIKRMRLLQF